MEGVRRDVTVIVGSYLGSAWHARQIRDLTRPCPPGVDPGHTPTRIVCQRPFMPGALPAPLVKAGWARSARPPRDSVLPLTDAQIQQVASRAFIARDGMTLHAGAIDATIRAGTTLLPSDTFTAAILQRALGQRPIYFMPGAPAVAKLGLFPHTVREGIAWRIANGSVADRAADSRSNDIVKLSTRPRTTSSCSTCTRTTRPRRRTSCEAIVAAQPATSSGRHGGRPWRVIERLPLNSPLDRFARPGPPRTSPLRFPTRAPMLP